jgi:Na+/melibiose symporter-like transporter
LQIFLLAIVVLPFSIIGGFSFATSLLFAIPFIIGVALALGGWYLFPYIMYADIAENDQIHTGELKAGIYTGFPAILLNIFQAISLLFTGWVHGIEPKIQNTLFSEEFSIGYIVWGPIAAGILIISYIFAKKLIKLDFQWESEILESN